MMNRASTFLIAAAAAAGMLLPGAAAAQNQQAPVNDIYVVTPGDTLWGICNSFFGDPDYWPTLWSLNNEEVSNPHYIYPEQRLRFRAGTDVRPPSVEVGGDDVYQQVDDLSFDENFEPLVQFLATEQECRIYMPFSNYSAQEIQVQAAAFLSRSQISPLGVVASSPENKEMLAEGDTVYLRFRNLGDVACGDIYTIYTEVGPLTHPEVDAADLGQIYKVAGEVMISDVGDRWATAQIITSWRDIERDALITDRVPVTGRVRTSELSQDLDGYVIDRVRTEGNLLGRNEVVFIDRGRDDGVGSGTIFWIVRRGDPFLADNDSTLPDEVIGRLVVFAADDNVSTAVLTDQAVDVRIGDRITSRIE